MSTVHEATNKQARHTQPALRVRLTGAVEEDGACCRRGRQALAGVDQLPAEQGAEQVVGDAQHRADLVGPWQGYRQLAELHGAGQALLQSWGRPDGERLGGGPIKLNEGLGLRFTGTTQLQLQVTAVFEQAQDELCWAVCSEHRRATASRRPGATASFRCQLAACLVCKARLHTQSCEYLSIHLVGRLLWYLGRSLGCADHTHLRSPPDAANRPPTA